MSFWSTATEPKRNFRYKVTIAGFGGVLDDTSYDNIWFAKKATKPSFTVGEVKANFLDKTFYYPGRVEWNSCEITFYDPNNPNAVNVLAQMFANSGYFIPTDTTTKENYGTTSKSDATNPLSVGAVTIETLDQDGGSIETWTLNNAFIKSMKFGDLSYDSDDMTEITVEFRYDWASLSDDDGMSIFAQSPGKPAPATLSQRQEGQMATTSPFWADKRFEPARKHRFRVVYIPGTTEADDGSTPVTNPYWWWTKSVTLPSFEIGEEVYQMVNRKFKYPGLLAWNDVQIVLYEKEAEATRFMSMMASAGYKFSKDEKKCGNGILKGGFSSTDLSIEEIGPSGKALQTFKLINWYIKAANFGDLTYDDDGFVTITVTIGYDAADITSQKAGQSASP